MSDEPLKRDDPNYGTVDDPGFEDPYAHLRDKAKEQGTTDTETETAVDDVLPEDPFAGQDQPQPAPQNQPPAGAGDQSGA